MIVEQSPDLTDEDLQQNSQKFPVRKGNAIYFANTGEAEAYRLGCQHGQEQATHVWRHKAFNWLTKAIFVGSGSLLCVFLWSKNEISARTNEQQETINRQQRLLDKYRDYIIEGKVSADTLELKVI